MPRQKFNAELCTRELTSQQRSELPNDVWKFLLRDVGGSLGAVHQMKANKLQAAAFGFVDSEIGRSYWPPSDMDQLQCEASSKEIEAFVADLMSQQRKKHADENPSYIVDLEPYRPKPSPSKTPRKSGLSTPARPTPIQSKLNLSSKKPTPVVTENASKQQTRSTTTSFSQESYNPPTPTREKSSTVAPDMPYREHSVHSPPTPKRSIRPTEASRRIAFGAIESASTGTPNKIHEDDGDTIVVDAPQQDADRGGDVPLRSKRPAEESGENDRGLPTPVTPAGQPNKRLALGQQSRPSIPAAEVPEASQPVTSPTVANEDRPLLSSTSSIAGQSHARSEIGHAGSLFRACGLEFASENLAEIPEVILAYIEQCEDECTRSAIASESAEKRGHFEYRARLFMEIYRDIESRIRCRATDAKERRRMEKNFALSASRCA